MQSTRMRPWCGGFGIVVLALAVLAGGSFRDVAFAARTKAPSSQKATTPASRATAHTPPERTAETSVQALADLTDSLTALKAAVQEQARHIEQLTGRQEQQTDALDAWRADAEKVLSRAYRERTLTLAMAGVISLTIIGVLLLRPSHSHPPRPVPESQTAGQVTPPPPIPPMPRQEREPMDIQTAACCLSCPKGEDVILRAGAAHFSALVLADGATTLRRNGAEQAGGGGQAAELAARTAITYLTRSLLPAMDIEQMLTLLEDCFRDVRTALEESNAPAQTPGATTLLIGMLCQAADNRWYWLYGHVGNGVLALLHTKELLSSWPIHTPLLSKHTNGVITITLPGDEAAGFFPSVGVKPHRMGDLLVIGSDGLDHLDTLTKHADQLTFLNYLWKIVRDERSGLKRVLAGLGNGRMDGQWQKALELDDTTIGMLWAEERADDRNGEKLPV